MAGAWIDQAAGALVLKDVIEAGLVAGDAGIDAVAAAGFGLDRFFDFIVTSEEAGVDKPHVAPFENAIAKIKPMGNCIWMIGDNAINDIGGAKKAISSVTLQKVHKGVTIGKGECQPDALIHDFSSLRSLLKAMASA
jgi:putative hydrolase of the HAD superfamily